MILIKSDNENSVNVDAAKETLKDLDSLSPESVRVGSKVLTDWLEDSFEKGDGYIYFNLQSIINDYLTKKESWKMTLQMLDSEIDSYILTNEQITNSEEE